MTKEDYWTSKEIIASWKIHPFSLLTLIKQGEIGYEIDGLYRIEGFAVCEQLRTASLVLADLDRLYFKKSDVDAFEEKHPEYKPQEAPYVSAQGEIPPYLDHKNRYFSEELSIAIETWLAFYGPNGSLPTGEKHRKKFLKYLFIHHKKIFPPGWELKEYNAKPAPKKPPLNIDRILTMINCDSNGPPPNKI